MDILRQNFWYFNDQLSATDFLFTFLALVAKEICARALTFVATKSQLNTFSSIQARVGQTGIQFDIQATVASCKGKKDRIFKQPAKENRQVNHLPH